MQPKLFQNISLALAAGILLLSILLVPNNNYFELSSGSRCLLLSIMVSVFGGVHIFQKRASFKFGNVDYYWLGLLLVTGLSAFWSHNPQYAVYGLFTTLLLYLCFKVFETLTWDTRTENIFFYLSTIGLISSMVLIAIGLQTNQLSNYTFSFQSFDFLEAPEKLFNKHYLNSLIVLLLPFVLFRIKKHGVFLDLLLLLLSAWLIYLSQSTKIAIIFAFLAVIYAFFKINIEFKLKLSLAVGMATFFGMMMLVALSNENSDLKRKNSSIRESYSQNDRFIMWGNSFALFKESPLIGHGKNNWELSVGKYGYNDYVYSNQYSLAPKRFAHAHNSIMQIISELGIIGLLLYLGIGLLPIRTFLKRSNELSDIEVAAIVSLFLFFLLTLMYGLVYNFYGHFSSLTVLAVFALSIMNNRPLEPEEQAVQDQQDISVFQQSLSFVFLALAIWSAVYFYQTQQAQQAYKQGKEQTSKQFDLNPAEDLAFALHYWDNNKVSSDLAKVYLSQQDTLNAAKTYNEALLKDPYNTDLLHQYAHLLYQTKAYDKAFEISSKGLAVWKKDFANEMLNVFAYCKTNNNDSCTAKANNFLLRLEKYTTRFAKYSSSKNKNEAQEKIVQASIQTFMSYQVAFNKFMSDNNINIKRKRDRRKGNGKK